MKEVICQPYAPACSAVPQPTCAPTNTTACAKFMRYGTYKNVQTMAKPVECLKLFEDFQIFKAIIKFCLSRLLSFKLYNQTGSSLK